MSSLVLDRGNSSTKAALLDAAGNLQAPWRGTWLQFCDSPLAQATTRIVAVCSRPAAVEELRRWAGERPLAILGAELPLPQLGQYASCGADRVLLGLGLRQPGGEIVIDAGTACTLSAWRQEAGRPAFAGGLILPGPTACAEGLHAAAPHLPLVSLDWRWPAAAQQNTLGALGAALSLGYPAMLAACAAQLQAETGISTIIITGGHGVAWQAADRLPLAWRLQPWRGLQCLAALAQEQLWKF